MKQVVFLLLLSTSYLSSAQDPANQTPERKGLRYNGSYYGNSLWNPGLKVGATYLWKERTTSKTKTRGKKEISKIKKYQLLLAGNLGFYVDPKSHLGVFNHYGISYRKINAEGKQKTIGISPLGYYRSFLPETYEVSENESVRKVTLPGRSYYSPVLTLGYGKTRGEKKLNEWFFNLNIMILYPYNADFLPLLNLEYGYSFDLKKKQK